MEGLQLHWRTQKENALQNCGQVSPLYWFAALRFVNIRKSRTFFDKSSYVKEPHLMPKRKIDVRVPSNLCSKNCRLNKLSPIEFWLEMELAFPSVVVNSIKACSSLSDVGTTSGNGRKCREKRRERRLLFSFSSLLFFLRLCSDERLTLETSTWQMHYGG